MQSKESLLLFDMRRYVTEAMKLLLLKLVLGFDWMHSIPFPNAYYDFKESNVRKLLTITCLSYVSFFYPFFLKKVYHSQRIYCYTEKSNEHTLLQEYFGIS